MVKCLICSNEFKNNKALGCHVKVHGIKSSEYKIRFNLIKEPEKCKQCNCNLSEFNTSGYCNKHRDRSGTNNPFYGKKHTEKTINLIKSKNSAKTKELWQDPIYRERVIEGATGKKRSNEFKENQRKNTQNQMKDPKQIELRRKSMKKSWENGVIPLSERTSMNSSIAEKEILKYLIDYLPDELVENKTLRVNNKYYFPDIVINNKIIVEYFGNYWHCNPEIYDEHFIAERTKELAKDRWYKDKYRKNSLEEGGYIVFIIWELDYMKNKYNVLNNLKEDIRKCLEKLK